MKFRAPTYDEVLNHRVIVVTLSTSYLLMEMNLPKGELEFYSSMISRPVVANLE